MKFINSEKRRIFCEKCKMYHKFRKIFIKIFSSGIVSRFIKFIMGKGDKICDEHRDFHDVNKKRYFNVSATRTKAFDLLYKCNKISLLVGTPIYNFTEKIFS